MIRITRSDKNLHKSDTNRKELRESRSCVQHTLSTVVDIKFSSTNQSRSKSNKVGNDTSKRRRINSRFEFSRLVKKSYTLSTFNILYFGNPLASPSAPLFITNQSQQSFSGISSINFCSLTVQKTKAAGRSLLNVEPIKNPAKNAGLDTDRSFSSE